MIRRLSFLLAAKRDSDSDLTGLAPYDVEEVVFRMDLTAFDVRWAPGWIGAILQCGATLDTTKTRASLGKWFTERVEGRREGGQCELDLEVLAWKGK